MVLRSVLNRIAKEWPALTPHTPRPPGASINSWAVGGRYGTMWCAGQDCGERGAAAETEGGLGGVLQCGTLT
ncbi:hypothetical protein E2C01_079648 [Portunus trituberculatus]|uniref:Uncharacterized protein n=1 Tax=Portunus trituberculatus TaxID=210409 RepID=A0A5B7ITB8_PORTR|nr:hypothetical protein [Portunus trituberculatus]